VRVAASSQSAEALTIPGAHRIAIGRSSRALYLTATLGDLGG
jgi:hypothetical protein